VNSAALLAVAKAEGKSLVHVYTAALICWMYAGRRSPREHGKKTTTTT